MAVRMTMTVTMAVRVRVRVRGALGRRHVDHVAVAHAALGDYVIGERLHFRAAAFEHRHLEAACFIKMHVQRRLRQVVMIVEFLRHRFAKR